MPRKVTKPADENASAKKEVSSVRKLKMLFTVIDRSKTLFYVDLLEQFEVNVQMVLYGKGTANSQIRDLLGLTETEKSVIISYFASVRRLKSFSQKATKKRTFRLADPTHFFVYCKFIYAIISPLK